MDLGGDWRAAPSTDDLRRAITAGAAAGEAGTAESEAGAAENEAGAAESEAGAAEGGSSGDWVDVSVPGHWRSSPALAASDGPVLYRREFTAPAPDDGRRHFLTFDGIFYQGDVWLDGEYLGDTEGYFVPHSFEVGDHLRARTDHVVTVEVTCSRPSDLTAKRNLTGVFQHWDCIDPDWNPGGVWAGVHLDSCGPVRMSALKVLCREAREERAVIDLEATLDRAGRGPVTIDTAVTREGRDEPAATHTQEATLASGANTIRWRVAVERPELWWPRALGAQPLYEVSVTVRDAEGRPSDRRTALTGLRQVRMRDFVVTVNGERLFLKGANAGPTRRDPAAASAADVRADVDLAVDAGLDLLRLHAHIARPELYDQADRRGMLLWQDLPLQWQYGRVRRQAVEQARAAVRLLGHHPSIAVWCGHNEPDPPAPPEGESRPAAARRAAAHVLPTWNRTGLDRSIRRALERTDGSRPVVAHSGVVPHPLGGTDTHLWFGWYRGEARDLATAIARLPVLGRFVSEFGAQAVPQSAAFMAPEQWPDLDWDGLAAHHCLQRPVLEARVPVEGHATFDSWRRATQAYQAELLRLHVETLRLVKYRPAGGFCFFLLADAQPAVSWSVLDHERVPKAGFDAVRRACRPVAIVASPPPGPAAPGRRVQADLHVVSDLRTPLAGAVAEATLAWPGGSRSWRFGGDVGPDRAARVGRIVHTLPDDAPSGPLSLGLRLVWEGGESENHYSSDVTAGGGI